MYGKLNAAEVLFVDDEGPKRTAPLVAILSGQSSSPGDSGGSAGPIRQFQLVGWDQPMDNRVGQQRNMPMSAAPLVQVFGAGKAQQRAACGSVDQQPFRGGWRRCCRRRSIA